MRSTSPAREIRQSPRVSSSFFTIMLATSNGRPSGAAGACIRCRQAPLWVATTVLATKRMVVAVRVVRGSTILESMRSARSWAEPNKDGRDDPSKFRAGMGASHSGQRRFGPLGGWQDADEVV
jgi:hypothetical protein